MIFITTKVLKSLKIKYVIFLMLLKLTFHISFRNKLRLIEFSSLFAIRRRNAEIIKKRNFKNHTENVKIKELFELFNRFMKNSQNRRFIATQKHNAAKQN